MIEWNGQKFYLIDGYYLRRDGVSLHRLVWEEEHGPLPDGFHVHHEDEDKTNNDPANLVLLDRDTHRRLHTLPAAAAWHRSEEGRAWHRANPPAHRNVPRVCERCGENYVSLWGRKTDRYCSQKCKQRARRARLSASNRPKDKLVSPEVHAKA